MTIHSLQSLLRFYIFILIITLSPILFFNLVGYYVITEMFKDKEYPGAYKIKRDIKPS